MDEEPLRETVNQAALKAVEEAFSSKLSDFKDEAISQAASIFDEGLRRLEEKLDAKST